MEIVDALPPELKTFFAWLIGWVAISAVVLIIGIFLSMTAGGIIDWIKRMF